MIHLIGIEIVVLILITFIFGYIYSKIDNKHFGFKHKIDPYYFSLTKQDLFQFEIDYVFYLN